MLIPRFLSSLVLLSTGATLHAVPDLVAHWPLDALTDGQVSDISGSHGLDASGLSSADLIPGRHGQAVAFDGSRETLLARTHAADDRLPISQYEAFSVSLWVRGEGQGQNDLRVFSEASSASNTPLFNIGTDQSGNSRVVDIYIRPGAGHRLSAANAFDNAWHHLAWVQDGNSATLYIDGTADGASFEAASGLDVDITSIGGIRRSGGDSHWFTGGIDDVSLWEGALTADEVARLASGETPQQLTGEESNGNGGEEPTDPTDFVAEGDHLRIMEFLASNQSQLADGNGDYSDWLELWNPTGEAIQLEGHFLTDAEGETSWVFPSVIMEPNERLIVWASGTGNSTVDELHTDFRLSRDAGGYIALIAPDGTTVIDAIANYPRQRSDVSYGYDTNDQLAYFPAPTPGEKNNSAIAGYVQDTRFSVDRGFYDEPFALEITTDTEGASIYYTTDGSEPTQPSLFKPANGTLYEGPIQIATTTTIRAKAFKAGFRPTDIDTQTYLFINDVTKQPAQPEDWPEDWGRNGEVPGRVVADYEMDPRVVDHTEEGYSVREALLDIPTLSIVMDRDDFIGSNGIYTNPQSRGADFEKPCSLELIYPNGDTGFQVDCGVEVHGNSSRRPWRMQKHSLRVSFKSVYGVSVLNYPLIEGSPIESFNKIVLRACFTDSWGLVSWGPSRYRPNDSQYIRDMWMKHSMRDMGHDSLDGTFMHLYVNGLYWGLFNPAEKMEAESLVTHLGGQEGDYDVIDDFTLPPIDGNVAGWNRMHQLSREDLDEESNYRALAEVLDLENFADYMLLHFFGDAEDWPHHNGHAMSNRGANGPFQFYVWDQEIALDNLQMKRYDSADANRPGGLFQQLRDSEEFQLLFADRVQKHLFNDGALTVKACQDRYMALANRIDKAIVAESARWGDTQESTPYGNTIDQPRDPNDVDDLAYPGNLQGYFTRENSWVIERDNVVNHYIPTIHDLSNNNSIFNELEDADLWPNTKAPSFSQHGGMVPEGYLLEIEPNGGFRGSDAFYYTMDGSDPRLWGGDISLTATAYTPSTEGIPLTESVTIRARLLSKSNPFLLKGEWSPLIEATFRVGSYASPSALQVSEIMYQPALPSDKEVAAGFQNRRDFEFLELVNTSSNKILLEGLQISSGLTVSFPEGPSAEVGPGDVILLVANREAMALRYGENLPIVGVFERSSQLANNGEAIALADASGMEIWRFAYNDAEDWPQEADGAGHSLENAAPGSGGDLNEPTAWKASAQVGGTPGSTGSVTTPTGGYATWRAVQFGDDASDASVSGPLADPDDDGFPNLLEYGLGMSPLAPSTPEVQVTQEGNTTTARYVRVPGITDLDWAAEQSSDLENWDTLEPTLNDADLEISLPSGPNRQFLRLRVTPMP